MKRLSFGLVLLVACLMGAVETAQGVAVLYQVDASYRWNDVYYHGMWGTFYFDSALSGAAAYSNWSLTTDFRSGSIGDFTFTPSTSDFSSFTPMYEIDTNIGPTSLALQGGEWVDPLDPDDDPVWRVDSFVWLGFDTALDAIGLGATANLIVNPGGMTPLTQPSGIGRRDGYFWFQGFTEGTVTNLGDPASPIPEPGSILLLSLGLLGSGAVAVYRRRGRS